MSASIKKGGASKTTFTLAIHDSIGTHIQKHTYLCKCLFFFLNKFLAVRTQLLSTFCWFSSRVEGVATAKTVLSEKYIKFHLFYRLDDDDYQNIMRKLLLFYRNTNKRYEGKKCIEIYSKE